MTNKVVGIKANHYFTDTIRHPSIHSLPLSIDQDTRMFSLHRSPGQKIFFRTYEIFFDSISLFWKYLPSFRAVFRGIRDKTTFMWSCCAGGLPVCWSESHGHSTLHHGTVWSCQGSPQSHTRHQHTWSRQWRVILISRQHRSDTTCTCHQSSCPNLHPTRPTQSWRSAMWRPGRSGPAPATPTSSARARWTCTPPPTRCASPALSAPSAPETLLELIENGMNVARMNFPTEKVFIRNVDGVKQIIIILGEKGKMDYFQDWESAGNQESD